MNNANKTESWQILGYLGLIPFLAALGFTFLPLTLSNSAMTIFIAYSAIILSFLAGSQWSESRKQRSFFKQSFSIITSLIAFCSLLIPALVSLHMLPICYLLFWFIERKLSINDRDQQRYIAMRTRLTSIVFLCHLAALYLWLY